MLALYLFPFGILAYFGYKFLRKLYFLVNFFIKIRKLPTLQGQSSFFGWPHLFKLRLQPGQVVAQMLAGTRHFEPFRSAGFLLYWIGPFPMAFATSPEAAQAVLGNAANLDRSFIYRMTQPGIGGSTVSEIDSNKWKKLRRLTEMAFHKTMLPNYDPILNKHAKNLVRRLLAHVKTTSDMIVDDISPFISYCAVDVLAETSYGVDIAPDDQMRQKYVKMLERLLTLMTERAMTPLYYIGPYYWRTKYGKETKELIKAFHNLRDEAYYERKKYLLENKKIALLDAGNGSKKRQKLKPQALMDLLITEHLRNPHELPEQLIKDEAAAFLVAGQDTTAWAMIWIIYRVGLDMQIQCRVHEEVDRVFGADLDRDLTAEDLPKLEYLDCVIMEGLRLYPTVPFIGRTLGEDTEVNGFVLPKGLSVTCSLQVINRDERYWPKSEVFDPERFLPENLNEKHPYASIPFSGGARNCVGNKLAKNKLKIILATLFRTFHVESLMPHDKSKSNGCGIVNSSGTPIPVKLTVRI